MTLPHKASDVVMRHTSLLNVVYYNTVRYYSALAWHFLALLDRIPCGGETFL